MTKRTAPPTPREAAPMRLPVDTGDISSQIGEVTAGIARRAYECFEARGGQHGDDIGDWLRAEEELAHRVPFHSRELDDRIELDVEVAQGGMQHLLVSAEPRRLLIRSAHKTAAHEPGEPTSTQDSLFHVIDLPFEIDVDKVVATLNEGNLKVTCPKQVGRSASTPNPDLPREEEPNSTEATPVYVKAAG